MPERGLHFYSELVIVTVVSLVAAQAWYHWFVRFLNKQFGSSITMDFIAAASLTLFAIFGLHLLFSQKTTRAEMTLPQGLVYKKASQDEGYDHQKKTTPYNYRPPQRYLK